MKKYVKKPYNRYGENRGPGANFNFRGYDPGVFNNSTGLFDSFNHMSVKLMPGESAEGLLRRFKRIVEDAGLLAELRKREHYISRGQKARLDKMRGIKRAQKARMNEVKDED